jgi:integrase
MGLDKLRRVLLAQRGRPMKLKLDTKTVAGLALAQGRGEDFAWDTELEGFGLRLRRKRDGRVRRTWAAQYRANGRTRRITLGSAEKVTVAKARDGARKILARVALGHDPQAEKQEKRVRSAQTFRATVEAYLAAKQDLRPISVRLNTLYLTGGYFRALHSLGMADISHRDIAARLTAITRDHSAHTAAAARRAISALCVWAVEEGLITTNPVIGTRKPAEAKPRERVLDDAELGAVWRACGNDDFGKIVRLLILLGGRRQEVGGMCWSEFDLGAGTWTLPATRSKNGRSHTVSLSAAALAIVKSIPRTDRDHLFGVRAGAGFTGWSNAKAELDQHLADAVKPWRLHDLRRTVATGMADIGIEPHIIEAVLNHYSGHRKGPHGVYNVSRYERQVKAALQRWSENVLALVEGRASKVVASTPEISGPPQRAQRAATLTEAREGTPWPRSLSAIVQTRFG